MYYFGYGSNMPKARLEKRLGPVERIGAAHVDGYVLRFHKRSTDGSGKCDAVCTGNPDDRLWGSLDLLTDEQISKLDRFEKGYSREQIYLTVGEKTVEAAIYLAKPSAVDPGLVPYDWYKDYVLAGARELGLPSRYVEIVEAVPSKPDPNPGTSGGEPALNARPSQTWIVLDQDIQAMCGFLRT